MNLSRRKFAKHALLVSTGCLVAGTSLLSASDNIHVVRKGETLSHVALRYGTSVAAIQQANNLSGDLIFVGQKLIIPVAGDSVDRLAGVRRQTASISVRTGNWDTIVVHHSAIKYGNAAAYDRAHRRRGMQNGLAYHFVIGNGIDSGNGEIEIGPRWHKQLHGGHVRNYSVNLTGIGICLVGNFQETHPTAHQITAFTQLMDWLIKDVLKKPVRFAGHKEIEKNICPGKYFPLARMHQRYG